MTKSQDFGNVTEIEFDKWGTTVVLKQESEKAICLGDRHQNNVWWPKSWFDPNDFDGLYYIYSWARKYFSARQIHQLLVD